MFGNITVHQEQAKALIIAKMALAQKDPKEVLDGAIRAYEIAVERRLGSDGKNRVNSEAVRTLMARSVEAMKDVVNHKKAQSDPARTAGTVVLIAPTLLEGFDYLDVLLDDGYSGEQKDQTIVVEDVIA